MILPTAGTYEAGFGRAPQQRCLLLIHLVGLDLHLELVRQLLDERSRAYFAVRFYSSPDELYSLPGHPLFDLEPQKGPFSSVSKPILTT